MNASTTAWIGMDVHGGSIDFAVLSGNGELTESRIENGPAAVRGLVKQLRSRKEDVIRACYEAGPTGFVLQRELESNGLICEVIAPSQIPKKSGDRVKTDRRDARELAELYRAGLLRPIHVPTSGEEAARNLVRRTERARRLAARTKTEIKSLLLSLGYRTQRSKWTKGHLDELRKLRLGEADDQLALDDALLALEQAEERVKRLDAHVHRLSETPALKPVASALQCFKGIAELTAVRIATEVPSPERFPTARHFMGYIGLGCSENSSGQTVSRGGITKTGNGRLRWNFVEAAQHADAPVGRENKRTAKMRREQPEWVRELARKAERRLHDRFYTLRRANKPYNVAVTAVARELAGFTWAVMTRLARERPVLIDQDGAVVHA